MVIPETAVASSRPQQRPNIPFAKIREAQQNDAGDNSGSAKHNNKASLCSNKISNGVHKHSTTTTISADTQQNSAAVRRYMPKEDFRDLFWLLSNSSTSHAHAVEQALHAILKHLRTEFSKHNLQQESGSVFIEDLHYTFARLFAGLAAPRSCSSYAHALMLILTEPYCTKTSLDYLLDVIHRALPIDDNGSNRTEEEIRHAHDGLLLAYSAVCSALQTDEIWQSAADSQILKVLKNLCTLNQEKASYKTVTDQLFVTILDRCSTGNSSKRRQNMLWKYFAAERQLLARKTTLDDIDNQQTDRMLFVALLADDSKTGPELSKLLVAIHAQQKWHLVAELLCNSWLDESQPVQIERLPVTVCLLAEYFVQNHSSSSLDYFQSFWRAICSVSAHQDGRVTGKTRLVFLLASHLLSCIHSSDQQKASQQQLLIPIILSDEFIELCVKCIKLGRSSTGKSGALVRLCETADEFMKDLMQFLRSMQQSAALDSDLIYQLLVQWFEHTWRTLTKSDEAEVIMPLLSMLDWHNIAQFTNLLVEHYEKLEKRASKKLPPPRKRLNSSTAQSSEDDEDSSSNSQPCTNAILRQRLLYLIGTSLSRHKTLMLNAAEWQMVQSALSLLIRLACSSSSSAVVVGEEEQVEKDKQTLQSVARRELLNVLHRLDDSHHRNKLFSPYADGRLVLLKILHEIVSKQTIQLDAERETQRAELESLIKKMNKQLLRSEQQQKSDDDEARKLCCLKFAIILAEKCYCDWLFVPACAAAVGEIIEGCRNILHHTSSAKQKKNAAIAELDADAETETAEADCVDVAVDLVLALLLTSRKEQDFIRICFANISPVLEERHIQKLLDASLDSFSIPAEEDEEEEEGDNSDVDGDDDHDDDDGEDDEHEDYLRGDKRKAGNDDDIDASGAEEEQPALSDTEMLALDDQLAQTFRTRVAAKKRREQEQAFPMHVLALLLDFVLNTSTTTQQHITLITQLVEIVAQPSPAANIPDKQAYWRKYVLQATMVLSAFNQRRSSDNTTVTLSDDAAKIVEKQLPLTIAESTARLVFVRDSTQLTNSINAVFYLLRVMQRSGKGEDATVISLQEFYKNFLEFMASQKSSSSTKSSSGAASASGNNNNTINSFDFLLQRVSGWLDQNGYCTSIVLPLLAERAFTADSNDAAEFNMSDYRRSQLIQLLSTLTTKAAAAAAAATSDHTTERFTCIIKVAEKYAEHLSSALLPDDADKTTKTNIVINKRWFGNGINGLDQILRKLQSKHHKNLAKRIPDEITKSLNVLNEALLEQQQQPLSQKQHAAASAVAVVTSAVASPPLSSVMSEEESGVSTTAIAAMPAAETKSSKKSNKKFKTSHPTAAAISVNAQENNLEVSSSNVNNVNKKVRQQLRRINLTLASVLNKEVPN